MIRQRGKRTFWKSLLITLALIPAIPILMLVVVEIIRTPLAEYRFGSVKKGMSRTEVIAILGEPAEQGTRPSDAKSWLTYGRAPRQHVTTLLFQQDKFTRFLDLDD